MKVLGFIVLVCLLIKRGESALEQCTGTPATCPDSEANANSCDGGSPTNLCVCDATYEPNSPAADACIAKECTAHTDCSGTTPNSYCNSAPNPDICACKTNFVVSTTNCARVSCSNDTSCVLSEKNSYCATGDAAGCTCGFFTTVDANTGACTPKNCTADFTAACGTGTAYCVNHECKCAVNKIPGATTCDDRGCTLDSHCTNTASGGDANSECNSSNKCQCKEGYVNCGPVCATQAQIDAGEVVCGSGAVPVAYSIHLMLLTLGFYKLTKMFE